MNFTNEIEEIFYFDVDGVTRLFDQIKLRAADSYTKENSLSRDYSGAFKPEIGTGSLLTKILACLKLAAEFSHKRSRSAKTVESHILSVQDRFAYLLSHLTNSGRLKRGLESGWLDAYARGGSSYCLFDAEFRPEAVQSDDWIAEANQRQTLIVTDTDRQYRMGMGFAHLSDASRGKLHHTSHTAIRIRDGAKMRVFGRIEKSRYIKPYSVSWL